MRFFARAILIVVSLSISGLSLSYGQDEYKGFILGYNGGGFVPSPRNFELNMWESNLETGETNHPTNYLRGFHTGYGMGNRYLHFDFLWQHKKLLTEQIKFVAETAPAPDTIGIQQFKIRLNSLNLAVAAGFDPVKIGVSIDFGGYKIFNKTGSESKTTGESFRDAKWVPYYDSKGHLFLGTTVFMLLRYKFLYVRPYYQYGHWQRSFLYQRSPVESMHITNNWGINIGLMLLLPS